MEWYKITDIERALKIMYPTKSILSKPTMIRYLGQSDPILIPAEWKKLEESKGIVTWFVTVDAIVIIVEEFNGGKRERVDKNVLLDYIFRVANGEVIEPENDVVTLYKKVKDSEKREEDLKRRLADAINKSNEIERQYTNLLTMGSTEKDNLEREKKELQKRVDEMKSATEEAIKQSNLEKQEAVDKAIQIEKEKTENETKIKEFQALSKSKQIWLTLRGQSPKI